MEHELLPYEERVIGICPCGAPLYPVLDDEGNRIGVTHETIEDDLGEDNCSIWLQNISRFWKNANREEEE